MKRIFLPLLAASLLSLSACNSNTEQGTGNSTASKSGAMADSATTTMPAAAADPATQPAAAGSAKEMGADPNGPTAPHATDAQFMMSAAHSDQNEMQLSKMALAKGVSASTKAFANQMIADHTKSTNALKPIAAKAGVTLPTDMDAAHKAMAPQMQQLSGKAFEDKYLQQMIADHQMTANTLAAHKEMTKNAALTGWINTTLPVVTSHLTMAKKDGSMAM